MSSVELKLKIPGCENFYWYEVLYCPKWDCHIMPTDRQHQNLIHITSVLQKIRTRLACRIRITSGLRPKVYNTLIGGAGHSAHIWGMALDFQVQGIEADAVRSFILPDLEEYKIRMEDLPGSSWVHIDSRNPRTEGRFFKP